MFRKSFESVMQVTPSISIPEVGVYRKDTIDPRGESRMMRPAPAASTGTAGRAEGLNVPPLVRSDRSSAERNFPNLMDRTPD